MPKEIFFGSLLFSMGNLGRQSVQVLQVAIMSVYYDDLTVSFKSLHN